MYAAVVIPCPLVQSLERVAAGRRSGPVGVLAGTGAAARGRGGRGGKGGEMGAGVIVEVNAEARACGVVPGMTATQGEARCPGLRLERRCSGLEEEMQRILLESVSGFSRDYESTSFGAATVDLFGTRFAPAGGERFARRCIERLRQESLWACVGSAPDPDRALLAARAAAPVLCVSEGRSREALGGLPLQILEPEAAMLEVLRLWGVRTVGAFLDLPRAELVARLGLEAAHLQDRAAGKRRRLLRLHRVPEQFSAALELDYEIEQLEPLLFLLRRMLETVCARLEAVYAAASGLILRLGFADRKTETMELRIPDPSREAGLLFGILHTRLESFRAASPVVSLELEALLGQAVCEQRDLFDPGLRDPNRFAGTVGRLEALLGGQSVGIPRLRFTHRPDAVETGPPFGNGGNGGSGGDGEKGRSAEGWPEARRCLERALGLPLRRFRPPLTVQTVLRRGEAGEEPGELVSGEIAGLVLCSRGPYRLSGDWWEKGGEWEREEWDVEIGGDQAGLYRLVRERGCWLLDGVYG